MVQSFDPVNKTTKYLLTNQLTWDATKIISTYYYRWVIEEFFRNAKQLTDMEGTTIRSEQGITISLYLVSWIDFLLHSENNRVSTAGELTKESLTIPSIVRGLQYENQVAFLENIQNNDEYVNKWLDVTRERINRKRKRKKQLITLDVEKMEGEEHSVAA